MVTTRQVEHIQHVASGEGWPLFTTTLGGGKEHEPSQELFWATAVG